MSNKLFDIYFYHANCMDGLTAIGIAGAALPDTIDFFNNGIKTHAVQYGDPIDVEALRGCSVCFLDFSVGQAKMLEILNVAKHVTVIDHHVSVHEELALLMNHENFEYVYDVTKCGAELAWEYFFPQQPAPIFLELIGIRDLWKPNGKAMADNLNLSLRVQQWDVSKTVNYFQTYLKLATRPEHLHNSITSDPTLNKLIKAGHSYKEYHNYMVDEICKHAYHAMLDNEEYTDVMKVNCPLGLMSDVGSKLSERFGVAWLFCELADSTKHSIRVSATDDFDAASYCKSKGGGGHVKAAGWYVNHLKKSTSLKEIMSR